jgi:oxygen-dependent protoporphyrinogen oxidase
MVSDDTRDVIVVGGGITGLTAAWQLRRRGVDACLLEAETGVGGCMRSERRDGFLLEKGPFNVLVRDPAFRGVLDECAGEIGPRVAAEAARRRYLLRRGALHEVPTGPGALLRTPLLSGRAKARLLRGMLLSRRARVEEPTIAQAAERRLGPEVAETFISSIVAGVFGGDSRELSLKACFPKAWAFDRRCRSPLLYEMSVLRQRRREAKQAGGPPPLKGLVSFGDGLQALPDWLGAALGPDLVTGCRVESIERHADGWTVDGRVDGDARRFACRRLVLATPKQGAAGLLAPLAPAATAVLDEIECASLVVLNLGYRSRDVEHPMVGYGFLVPANEPDMPVMGVLWADSAFPHHAADDRRLVRVFMGGPRDPHAADRPTDELLATATSALGGLLGLRADPVLVDVCRWPAAIPQYHLGHEQRLDRLDAALRHLPDLHLAGNYLRGVSINDCVRDGLALGDSLAGTPDRPPRSAARPRTATVPPIGAAV